MAYVAVKGGQKAIAAAHALLAEERRGDSQVSEITLEQIKQQMKLAVDRVMAEGSLYDPELAALAVKQAHGDLMEAIFLLRAYRTTLPRFGDSLPVNTSQMRVQRRISATWKDIAGGQMLGGTFDYTHRLLDRKLAQPQEQKPDQNSGPNLNTEGPTSAPCCAPTSDNEAPCYVNAPIKGTLPRALEVLEDEGLLERAISSSKSGTDITDITRTPLELPADSPAERDVRLQSLSRADEGFLLSMAYSTQRGFGASHPFTGELRRGKVELSFEAPELGFAVPMGEIELTECETVSCYTGTAMPAGFTRGYGLVFGNNERKALSMSIVDRALRAKELEEPEVGPAQNTEFVLMHGDNVDASGFVQHIKLPHYVDFQADLSLIRGLRAHKVVKI